MNPHFMVTPLATGLMHPSADTTDRLATALEQAGASPIRNGDIPVLAESMIATTEGRLVSWKR